MTSSQQYGLVNEQAPEQWQGDSGGDMGGGGDDFDDDDHCEGAGFECHDDGGGYDLNLVDAPTRVGKIEVKYETVAKKVRMCMGARGA